MDKLPDTKDPGQITEWPAAVHIFAAKPLLSLISILSASLGGILLIGGIYLAFGGSVADTRFTLFSNEFSSTSVGVSMAFMGSVMIILTFRRILASVDHLAGLPNDISQSPSQANWFSKETETSPELGSVAIKSNSKFTDGDWITAAIVGPEHAEAKLKELASEFRRIETTSRDVKLEMIMKRCQYEISELLVKYEKGGDTDETRLDACIAKVMADILQRELSNFQWIVEERLNDDPTTVFRDMVKESIESERNKYKS